MEFENILGVDDFSLYQQFEVAVEKILRENGFGIENIGYERGRGYDFDIFYSGGRAIVETKLYRSVFPKIDLIRTACRNLAFVSRKRQVGSLLIITSITTPSLKEEIFKDFNIVMLDGSDLLSLSFDHGNLYFDILSLLTRILRYGEFPAPQNGRQFVGVLREMLNSSYIQYKPTSKVETRGAELCAEMKTIVTGRKANVDKDYENKCIEILKYLFDNNDELGLFDAQLKSSDGLNRYDLLCKIVSYKNNFWSTLASDFKTRYVIFEFKNYADKIKQTQIYTTEKYLYTTALRSVSFILSRKGGDDNAIIAANGALKESGKLIIILSDNDVCDMLKLKDNGEEPSLVLAKKIDCALTTLTR